MMTRMQLPKQDWGLSMKLKSKLPVAALCLTIFAIGATAVSAISIAGGKAHDAYYEKLAAVANGRANELSRYLENIRVDVINMAGSAQTLSAVHDFTAAWADLGEGQTEELQTRYISGNPFDLGEKHRLDTAGWGDLYDETHANYHIRYRNHLEALRYYDIFLFDTEGNLLYTVFKENDFATNLNDGQWKDTGLGRAYRAALSLSEPGSLYFDDFEAYAPSNNAPAAFLSAPVIEGGHVVGVFAIQMPNDAIREILANNLGLGETGETLLLNDNLQLLTDSPKTDVVDTLNVTARSPAAAAALKGERSTGTMTGYRNIETMLATEPVSFLKANWVVAAVVDEAEVSAVTGEIRNTVLMIAAILLALAAAASIWFSRSITAPITRLVGDMIDLAGGKLDIALADAARKDEIGDMVRSVEVFRDAARTNMRLEEEAAIGRKLTEEEAMARAQERARVAAEQKAALKALSDALDLLASGDLEHRIADDLPENYQAMAANYNAAIHKLMDTMADVRATAVSLNSVVDDLAQSGESLATRSNQQAASLEESSTAITEITESIRATAQRSERARDVVGNTHGEVLNSRNSMENAVVAMQAIEQSSHKISSILGVIDDIAFQTNLLALNAGVEAARAGEAGKGFAVVAQEVRDLAQRCAAAAHEIKDLIATSTKQVEGGVGVVNDTRELLDQIVERMDEIRGHIGEISSATAEQSAGLSQINGSIHELDTITQQNTAMTQSNADRIRDLRTSVANLTNKIRGFRTRNREVKAIAPDGREKRLIGDSRRAA